LEEKDASIGVLEHKIDGLLRQVDTQTRTIDQQNQKIASLTLLGSAEKITPPTAMSEKDRFEADLRALDSALNDTTSSSSSRKASPEFAELAEARTRLAQRDAEIANLKKTLARLEALAFASDKSGRSDDEQAANEAKRTQAQLRFLKETNDEQTRTIQLQKSTIGSLKEELELLTRQLNDFQGSPRDLAVVAVVVHFCPVFRGEQHCERREAETHCRTAAHRTGQDHSCSGEAGQGQGRIRQALGRIQGAAS
jgi:chromosome segregation ATPase